MAEDQVRKILRNSLLVDNVYPHFLWVSVCEREDFVIPVLVLDLVVPDRQLACGTSFSVCSNPAYAIGWGENWESTASTGT